MVDAKYPLSKKTRSFLLNGANPGNWDKALKSACQNLKDCRYDMTEAIAKLSTVQCHGFTKLSSSDISIISSVYTKLPVPSSHETAAQKGEQLNEMLSELQEMLKGRLLIYRDPSGSETYMWHKTPTIVERISFDGLKQNFFEVLQERGMTLQHKHVVELLKTFLLGAKELKVKELPPAYSTDPEEICFKYLNLEIEDTPTPTWDAFINYCGPNGKALMAYTWSIFEAVELRQYLLLRSQGKTGKGSYTEWVQNIIGEDSTCSLSPKNPHWPAMCVGKRLGLFPELNQTSFVQSSEFKAITGHDYVNITQKHEKAYSAKLDIRFILSTNGSIDIEGRTSESSRCILVDMQPVTTYIPDYKRKLREETKGFLFKCKQAFAELYQPSNSEIMVDKSDFEAHSATFEDDYELLFQKAFSYDESSKIRTVTFTNAINAVGTKYDKYFKQNFKEWVIRNKNISMIKTNGNYFFKNLALSENLKNSELIIKFKDNE